MNIEELNKPKLQKVKMNCDDVIDMKLTKYPMVDDLWSRSSFNTIVGKMGQGKTSLITNLIKKYSKDAITIFMFLFQITVEHQ